MKLLYHDYYENEYCSYSEALEENKKILQEIRKGCKENLEKTDYYYNENEEYNRCEYGSLCDYCNDETLQVEKTINKLIEREAELWAIKACLNNL